MPADDRPAIEVKLAPGLVSIRDDRAFGPEGGEAGARFLGRAFAIESIRSAAVDRARRLVVLRHDAPPSETPALLARLVEALRGPGTSTASIPLPGRTSADRFELYRHGASLTSWEVVDDRPGRLKIRQASLKGDPVAIRRVRGELLGLPGVRFVKASERTGHLLIRFDPGSVTPRALLGLAESTLMEMQVGFSDRKPGGVATFGMANLTLGVAAVGEFLVPGLKPLSAVLLVATNVPTFRSAVDLLKQRRLGLPVLYFAIIATTLATGQFLASALMTWMFRFWHRRFRVELASERSRLLEHSRTGPELARLVVPSGAEVMVLVDRLKLGDRIAVLAGEMVSADGRVIAGEGVADERPVRGLAGISRKRAGDSILAGSTVLAGSLHVEVARLGEQTRAATIRRALVAATDPAPGQSAPTLRSERSASRAVGPTLATAGIGLLSGDLMAVGAILRPDYATGPGLAVPLETLHKVALCNRSGIVARDPEALERLAEVGLYVLQDHPSLRRRGLEIASIETQLPEPLLLRYAASAFRHLVDARASALLEACRARRIHRLDLEAVEFGRGVVVVHEKHRVRVAEADPLGGPASPLVVEVDGVVVGRIAFAEASGLPAAAAIAAIRRASHVPFALVSSAPAAEVEVLAHALGVEMFRGDFSRDETADFLAACRGRGLKAAFVGDCREHPRAAAEAHVAISLADPAQDGLDLDSDPAAFLVQSAGLDPLADLDRIARDHASRVVQAQKLILVPNLLCVAGAFFFGFTGMTVVMLSNLGTLGLYRIASDSLRGLEAPSPARPIGGQSRRAG